MNHTIDPRLDDLIDRYLSHRLDDDELSAFEIRLLDEPELFSRVQMAEMMKQALRAEAATLLKAPTTATRPVSPWWRQPQSIAASLLLASFALLQAPVLLDSQPGSDITRINTVAVLEATRGAKALEISGMPPYLLQIDAGVAQAGTRFDLRLAAPDELGSAVDERSVVADADGWVRLVLMSPLAGTYEIMLHPQGKDRSTPVLHYSLRVVR